MANLHDADLTAVGSTLSTPEVTNFIRELVPGAFQELIETDFAAVIGAQPHERTDTRTNQRNGHRSRPAVHPSRRHRVADPKDPDGQLLPPRCCIPAGGSTRRCTR